MSRLFPVFRWIKSTFLKIHCCGTQTAHILGIIKSTSPPMSLATDSQISEVAKMLYQQGLTELIHSSPSEQVAYLLVERASLLETSEALDKLAVDGNTASLLGTEAQVLKTAGHQVRETTAQTEFHTPVLGSISFSAIVHSKTGWLYIHIVEVVNLDS